MPLFYTPAYRLPIPSLEATSGVEPRRADLVAWYLLEEKLARPADLLTPRRADYISMLRVHDATYLESLAQADELARIFAVSPGEIVVDEVMRTLRLATGGTIAAARLARSTGGPTFNLFGGFHHAAPATGGGMCAIDDVAIAIAELRADGFTGRFVILDLDAHPPDGLAACVANDERVMIGSLSGSDWGPLPGRPGGVDETVVEHADDATYLDALRRLLLRMPRADFVFVLCGGDVLAGDRLGALSLTLDGVRQRDLLVAQWAEHVPSVWLPAGGYSPQSWKVLAGAYLAVSRRSKRALRDRDPLLLRFSAIARGLDPERLSSDIPADDVEAELYGRPNPLPRLLGYYTAEGVEYAITRYGLYDHLRRLGYSDLRISIAAADELGQRVTVTGFADGAQHLLIDLIVSRGVADGAPSLVVHWLSLRNPRAAFRAGQRALPGQEVPGLGLARDMGQLLGRMAVRLQLASVSQRPAYLHAAYAARQHFHFVDPARQERFVDLLTDLADVSLGALSRALAEGRVRRGDQPYAWEPDVMIARPGDPTPDLTPRGEHPRFTIAAI